VHRVRRAAPWLFAIVVAACTSQPTGTPSPAQSGASSTAPSSATKASPSPAASASRPTRPGPLPQDVGCADIIANKPPAYPDATIPPGPVVRIAGGDAAVAAAITRAADELAGLRSYRFTVDVVGRDITTLGPSTLDFAVEGTIDRSADFAIDAVMGSRMREPDGSAAISSGGEGLKAGHGYLWGTDNVSGDPEPVRDGSTMALIGLVTPEGNAVRYVTPFAAGYRRVGVQRHAGVATQHYQATAKGKAAYAKTLQFDGSLTADVWIAANGGHLVGARVSGTAGHVDPSTKNTVDDGFTLAFEVTRPNDPDNVVSLPATPVPDPVRPAVAPVDLELFYQIMPTDGKVPTLEDAQAIGVALRTRLDISNRPVRVDVLGASRLIVTVCGTTDPEGDRRLITSGGALTVVPLPKDRFGTASDPGPESLPPVGGRIDPSLAPIAPASGLGLTTAHVDPTTGQRGLAFRLGNQASEAFMTYAAAHQSEFVAVVLDGTVLATLPIDERTAKGNFVFTGDYTEAESHNLASFLYRDPITFVLGPTDDVEIPAQTP
jgi:hypothetical protein